MPIQVTDEKMPNTHFRTQFQKVGDYRATSEITMELENIPN